MNRGALTVFGLLVLLLLATLTSAAPTTVVLAVEGMTWGAWPPVVKRALEGLSGVSRADVSFQKKEAVVTFDPAQVHVDQMIEAVRRAGYRASLKSSGAAPVPTPPR